VLSYQCGESWGVSNHVPNITMDEGIAFSKPHIPWNPETSKKPDFPFFFFCQELGVVNNSRVESHDVPLEVDSWPDCKR
jgi:hypothetical protein